MLNPNSSPSACFFVQMSVYPYGARCGYILFRTPRRGVLHIPSVLYILVHRHNIHHDQCPIVIFFPRKLNEYDTFVDKGKDGTPPAGYKKISTHFVYGVKHDGRHKARYIADGHKTGIPLQRV